MDTLVDFLLRVICDLTGYWLLRLFGNQRPGEIAMTFAGAAFWFLMLALLIAFAKS